MKVHRNRSSTPSLPAPCLCTKYLPPQAWTWLVTGRPALPSGLGAQCDPVNSAMDGPRRETDGFSSCSHSPRYLGQSLCSPTESHLSHPPPGRSIPPTPVSPSPLGSFDGNERMNPCIGARHGSFGSCGSLPSMSRPGLAVSAIRMGTRACVIVYISHPISLLTYLRDLLPPILYTSALDRPLGNIRTGSIKDLSSQRPIFKRRIRVPRKQTRRSCSCRLLHTFAPDGPFSSVPAPTPSRFRLHPVRTSDQRQSDIPKRPNYTAPPSASQSTLGNPKTSQQ